MKDYEGREAVYLLDIEADPDLDQTTERLLAYLVVFKDTSDADGSNQKSMKSCQYKYVVECWNSVSIVFKVEERMSMKKGQASGSAAEFSKAGKKAYFHLPGLFEFLEFYRVFLPVFFEHREYFYDWCEIGSLYGAPGDCIWGGGRVGCGDAGPQEVKELTDQYGISAHLTFSNSLLRQEHLSDSMGNQLCRMFESVPGNKPRCCDSKVKNGCVDRENNSSIGREKNSDTWREDGVPAVRNGIIITSDLLMDYIHRRYPGFCFISSTTKVITDFSAFRRELDRPEFSYVVPDFRLNKHFDDLRELNRPEKDKTEFLVNECCDFACLERRQCYEAVSRKALGEDCGDHICASKDSAEGYVFSRAMKNPGFISLQDIQEVYLPMGFSQFKIEGRSLGSAMILEFLLYYMTKPEYQLNVREAIYLDSSLDLF